MWQRIALFALLVLSGCAHTAPLIHTAALYDPQIHECRVAQSKE